MKAASPALRRHFAGTTLIAGMRLLFIAGLKFFPQRASFFNKMPLKAMKTGKNRQKPIKTCGNLAFGVDKAVEKTQG